MTQSPSKVRYALENPTIGVHVTAAQRDALAARAKAAGMTMSALIMSGLADKNEVAAAEYARGVADGKETQWKAGRSELAQLRRDRKAELEDRDRQHAAALELAVEEALAASDTPAGRAASHRQATVTTALEQRELAQLARLERQAEAEHNREMARIRQDQLKLEAESDGFTAERMDELRQAVKMGREAVRKELDPQITEFEKRAKVAEAKVAERDRELVRLATLQDELKKARLDVALVPLLRSQIEDLTEQLRVAQRSPLLQFRKDHEARMRDLKMQGEDRQRQWDAEQAERAERQAAERAEQEQQQREQAEQWNAVELARLGLSLVASEPVERG